MTIFVVKGERAFYDDTVHPNIPNGAKAISQTLYEQLLQAQSDCRLLDFDVYPPGIKDRLKVWPAASELQSLIDDRAATVYAGWSRFEKEHEARELAAQRYKDNDFVGEVSIWIKSYADPSGLDYTEAATLILQQAQAQRAAREALAVLRMRKLELNALEGEQCYQRYLSLMEEINRLAATAGP
nr:hypothetical protein [uncultured Pseudomonas sp.]